jgi:TolB protein
MRHLSPETLVPRFPRRRSAQRHAAAVGAAVLSAVAALPVPAHRLEAQATAGTAPTPVLPVQDAYPHISREGLVVFQSNRVGGSKLFVARLDGGGLRQLTSGSGDDVTPVWSPDGTHVVFASDRDGDEEVWIVRADGTGLRSLTDHPASDSHPSWSPDGRQIVFCSTRGDGENDDIYVVNVDGSGLRRLTDNGLDWDTFPSFSRDGRKILFRRLLRARTAAGTLANSEVMVMNSDGTGAVNLSQHVWFDGWPSWSPDGRRIAFSSNRSDAYQIYVMNADGSGIARVVDSPYTDVRPQWLPDGRGLVFNREHDGRIEILQARLP